MDRELTQGEMEIVEQRLADMFSHECWELAEELGFKTPFTPEQEAELNAEFDRRHKPRLIADILQSEP